MCLFSKDCFGVDACSVLGYHTRTSITPCHACSRGTIVVALAETPCHPSNAFHAAATGSHETTRLTSFRFLDFDLNVFLCTFVGESVVGFVQESAH